MRLTCCWILGSVFNYETVDTKTIIPTSMFHYLDIYRFRIRPVRTCTHSKIYFILFRCYWVFVKKHTWSQKLRSAVLIFFICQSVIKISIPTTVDCVEGIRNYFDGLTILGVGPTAVTVTSKFGLGAYAQMKLNIKWGSARINNVSSRAALTF